MEIKKIILAVLLTVSTTAMADTKGYYISTRFEAQDGINGSLDANTFGVNVGKHVNKFFDIELATRNKDNQELNNDNDTRTEMSGIGKYKISDSWSASMRIGAGEKFVRSDNFGYWVSESGIKYKVNNDWALKSSIRWRDSFNSSRNQQDTTYAVAVEYQIDETQSVDLRYREKRGDGEYNALGIGYKLEL